MAHLLTTLPDYTWSDLEQTALHLVLVQRLLESGAARLDESSQTAGQAPTLTANLINSAIDGASYPDSAGIYRVEDGEAGLLALNLPKSELTLSKLDPEEIEESLLPDTRVSFFEQKTESDSSLLQEIWRPFLLAMLLFLLAEAILTLNKKPAPSTSTPSKKSVA